MRHHDKEVFGLRDQKLSGLPVQKAIRLRVQKLHRHHSISTIEQASQWGAQLHEFATVYRTWLNEKTLVKDPQTGRWTRTWIHANVRKAHNSLNHLWRSNLLFVYLNSPEEVIDTDRIKATTNSLEGGINSQLKLLTRTHRGRRGEHQRRMLDWGLYLKN